MGVLLAGLFFSAAAVDISRKGERYEVDYIKGFEHADTPLEVMFAWSGDGMAYAELARHPWIDPAQFSRGGRAEASYRASHPLWSWLGWVSSLGQSDWVLIVFLVLSIASAGFMVWVLACLMPNHPERALIGLLLPGSLAALTWLLPEPLGVSFAVMGLFTGGVGWLVVAGLVRESFLLVPSVLFLKTRNPRFLVPGAVWAAWQLFVWAKVGTPAWEYNTAGFDFGLPFVGMAKAAHVWGVAEIVALALLVAAGVVSYRKYPGLVIAYAIFGVCMGWGPWNVWRGFTRPMITLYVLGLISLDQFPRQRGPLHRVNTEAIA